MSIYDDMRQIASDVIGEFQQGSVVYVALEKQPGGTPDRPTPSVPVPHPINAVARPVSTKYVDGTNIVQSDKQITMPNDGVTPDMTGSIKIDGVSHKIIEIMPRPAAGTPVVWTVICRR